jgi:hypothetical protein
MTANRDTYKIKKKMPIVKITAAPVTSKLNMKNNTDRKKRRNKGKWRPTK